MTIGSGGFKWFFGTVEDRDDPLKLGRCKVRVEMTHDVDNTKKILTDDLPWAVSIMPLISASYKEIGLLVVTIVGMDSNGLQIALYRGLIISLNTLKTLTSLEE